MTQATVTKIRNNSVILPKAWKGSKVLLRVTGNTATITKLEKTDNIFSQSEISSLRKLGQKIKPSTVKKTLAKG